MSEKIKKPGTVTPQDEHVSSEPMTIKDERATPKPTTTDDEHVSGEPA